MTVLLDETRKLSASEVNAYQRYKVTVPAGTTRLEVNVHYQRPDGEGRIYPVLESPEGFRGFSMFREGRGPRTIELYVAQDCASPGAIPGPIPAGEWCLTLDPLAFSGPTTIAVQVVARFDALDLVLAEPYPEGHVVRQKPAWYRGELHAHTIHSDGNDTTEALVEAARELGLDFLVLTDHYTTSGWSELGDMQRRYPDIALMRGLELTSHLGHANLHGIKRWIDPLIDTPERDVNAVAREVQAQGGLFCVNHPYSNVLGWQRHDLDWSLVDLMEVYHHLEHQHNILQLALWDQLLNLGYRVVGVAGTDSHNAFVGRHRLGQCFTYVHARELSEAGIIEALKRGRVYATLGPEIEVHADSASGRAEMNESAALGERLTFEVNTRQLDRPATLYALKNGLYFERFALEPGESSITFSDLSERPAYYRFEWHALPHYRPNPGARYRSWDTLMTASNPIFVGADFAQGRWKPVA